MSDTSCWISEKKITCWGHSSFKILFSQICFLREHSFIHSFWSSLLCAARDLDYFLKNICIICKNLSHYLANGLPWWLSSKESTCQSGDMGLIPEVATYFSILAWKIPWTEDPGGLHNPWGSKRVGHNLATKQLNRYLRELTVCQTLVQAPWKI